MDMWSSVGGPRQKQGKRYVSVCVRVCHRWSKGLVLATKRGMPAEFASSPCDLGAICSGFFWSGSVFLRRPRLKHVAFFFSLSLSYVVDVRFYMTYLLVQHCHGRELSCSTKVLPSPRKTPLLWTNSDKRKGPSGGYLSLFSENPKQGTFVQPFRTVGLLCCPNKNNNLFLRGLSNLSNQAGIAEFASPGISKNLLLWTVFFFCHGGAPQVSSRHPLAFHASWYYRLFIQPLFKLDADRVALDMCIAKKIKKMLTVILNTFICRKHPLSWGCQKRVNDKFWYRNDAFFVLFWHFFFLIIKAMWYKVWADVMCFHHNGNSLMFRA